jgi:hypothetical protein
MSFKLESRGPNDIFTIKQSSKLIFCSPVEKRVTAHTVLHRRWVAPLTILEAVFIVIVVFLMVSTAILLIKGHGYVALTLWGTSTVIFPAGFKHLASKSRQSI